MNTPKKAHIITGGTGVLALYIARELCIADEYAHIIFLGRGKDGLSLQTRMEKKLHALQVPVARCTFIECDILYDSAEQLALLIASHGDPVSLWHCAANISFKASEAETAFRENTGLNERMIALATKIAVPYYFMSTAFSPGKTSGVRAEKLLDERHVSFNNEYERSKYISERDVVTRAQEGTLRALIFRPSILIETEVYTGAFSGYYVMIQGVRSLTGSLAHIAEKHSLLARIFGIYKVGDAYHFAFPFLYNKHARIDFMPVEWAAKWMVHIAERAEPNGEIFNICNPKPFKMRVVIDSIFKALNSSMRTYAVSETAAQWYLKSLFALAVVLPFLQSFTRKLKAFYFFISATYEHDMTHTKRYIDVGHYVVSENLLEHTAHLFLEHIHHHKT